MIRTVLFAVILAFGALTVMLPAAPAYAGNEKGFFSFFNRTKNDGSASGTPVHMDSSINGAAKGSDVKPFSFSKNPGGASVARYEDSPINEERARDAKKFADWNANELAKANASTQVLMEQVKAQQAYNTQLGRQQQAQKIAAAGARMSAGAAPGGANAAMVQAMRETARQQALVSMQPGAMGAAPPTPQAPPIASEAPAPEEPKRERKKRSLFNRITE